MFSFEMQIRKLSKRCPVNITVHGLSLGKMGKICLSGFLPIFFFYFSSPGSQCVNLMSHRKLDSGYNFGRGL